MQDDSLSVVVALTGDADADPEELERFARQLLAELRNIDVDSIDDAGAQETPQGAKGVELAELGVWLVTLSASGGVLTSLIAVGKDWLSRRSAGNRIKITIGDDSIELDGASSAQEAALLKAFITRHQIDQPPSLE